MLPESIGELINLVNFDISHNDLSELTEAIWSNSIMRLTNLESLDLRFTGLTSLPSDIENLIGLKSLDISKNQLIKLPDSISQLHNLESLSSSYVGVGPLPENLTTLNIHNSELSEIPQNIFQLTKLKSLRISCFSAYNMFDDMFTTLPTDLSLLSNLESLDLSYNDIELLPESIGALVNLSCLNLGHNSLNALPESIGRLEKLKELDLSNNNLNTLPESIGKLKALKELNISDNNLNILPDSIAKLKALEFLSLDNNRLADLSNRVIQFLESLGLTINDWQLNIDEPVVNQEPNYDMYLDEVPDNVAIGEVELCADNIEAIEQEVVNVLDRIIQDNMASFDEYSGYKVRPGYGYDKFYLDFVDGSYDMSLQSLIHYIMYEDGHYQKFLSKSQYARLIHIVHQYPESIFGLDEDLDNNYEQIQYELIDRVYATSIKFVAITLINSGFDVRSTFADYLEGWDENE